MHFTYIIEYRHCFTLDFYRHFEPLPCHDGLTRQLSLSRRRADGLMPHAMSALPSMDTCLASRLRVMTLFS